MSNVVFCCARAAACACRAQTRSLFHDRDRRTDTQAVSMQSKQSHSHANKWTKTHARKSFAIQRSEVELNMFAYTRAHWNIVAAAGSLPACLCFRCCGCTHAKHFPFTQPRRDAHEGTPDDLVYYYRIESGVQRFRGLFRKSNERFFLCVCVSIDVV